MTTAVKHGAASREKLIVNGVVVPYATVRYLKDGTEVYDFLGPRVDGKRPSRVTLKARTKTDAKLEIERLIPLVRDGKIGDRAMRLEPLYKATLAAMKSGEFTHSGGPYSPGTICTFKCNAEHVLRVLGRSTRVTDIKVGDLLAMKNRLLAEGLSGSAVRGCLSCASTMLRYAVQTEVRDHNPAKDISRGDRPSGERLTEPRYLTIAQVERLFARLTEESRAIAYTMFYGGLRVSEALALRWEHVGDQLSVPGTKTRSSAGTIPLHPKLAAELRAHKARMGERGFDRIGADQLVFQTRTGKPVHRRNVLRAIQAAGDKAKLNPEGVEKVGCHDLRHSLAANALAIPGMTLHEVSKVLRHSSEHVTATTYAGITEDGIEALGQKLAAL